MTEGKKVKSESSLTVTTNHSEREMKETVVDNKGALSEETSKMYQDKGPAASSAPQPPLSPTGSLHSDSGESGTGVGNLIFY